MSEISSSSQQDMMNARPSGVCASSGSSGVGGQPPEQGVYGRDLILVALSITAVILLASVLIVQVIQPEPAMALAQSGRAGKYMVATSQLDDTAELLMVFNTDVGQMNVYGFNVQASQLELLQQVDIGQLTQRMQEVRERLSRQGGR